MTEHLIFLDTSLTFLTVILGLNEVAKINRSMYRLKEDHFDMQVTFTKLLDAIEANKHEIGTLKRRHGD